jgi:hypothetical protein
MRLVPGHAQRKQIALILGAFLKSGKLEMFEAAVSGMNVWMCTGSYKLTGARKLEHDAGTTTSSGPAVFWRT